MSRKTKVLRLLMFKSQKCRFCPEVFAIVRKHVGNQKNVSLITIDADINPDIAENYMVTLFPTVVINNEKIIEGYTGNPLDKESMEAEIRDRLWSKIFQSVVFDSSINKRKETIFAMSLTLIDSLSKKEAIRPNIGDYVHLEALQITNMSLLALDRLASKLIYDAGRMQGLFGPGQMMLTRTNPAIFQQIRMVSRFHESVKGLVALLSDHSQFPLYIADRAEILHVYETNISIRVYGSAYAVSAPRIGEPLCYALAGEMAGQIQSMLGQFVKVTETACWGLGDRYCDFNIEVLPQEESMAISNEPSQPNEEQERRILFQTTLMEMSETFRNSIFYNRRMRSGIGDIVHISVVQQSLNALQLMDPYCSMILYSAGNTFGLTGPYKQIIQARISKLGLEEPLSLEKATEMVVWEFQHPTTLLFRRHSFVSHHIVDEERTEIRIEENVYSAGAIDVGETFCSFTAGYIKGRIQLLIDEYIEVKETKCLGLGDHYCLFEISLD